MLMKMRMIVMISLMTTIKMLMIMKYFFGGLIKMTMMTTLIMPIIKKYFVGRSATYCNTWVLR